LIHVHTKHYETLIFFSN